MSSLADLIAIPHKLEYEGKQYDYPALTVEDQARFCRRLEDRALDAASRTSGLPEARLQELMNAALRDIATGFYEWDGPGVAAALQTPWGLRYASYLALKKADPTVTQELASKIINANILKIAGILRSKADPKKA